MNRALRARGPWLTMAPVSILALVVLSCQTATQRPSDSRAIRATCGATEWVSFPTRPGTIPVVVTYMKNERRPADDVQPKFPKDRWRNGLAPDGEFNEVWRPRGIEFALAGFRACTYELSADFDVDLQHPRERVPKPNASDEVLDRVFIKFVRENNTKRVRHGGQGVAFRGLDLYVWWDVDGHGAFALRPGFGGQPDGDRPGAVWFDKNCLDEPRGTCAGLFAHEVGHFLGLCHCCHKEDEGPRCLNALRPQYCPGLPSAGFISCETSGIEIKARLMSASNPFGDPTQRKLDDCEVATAREVAKMVLEFGANGRATQQER